MLDQIKGVLKSIETGTINNTIAEDLEQYLSFGKFGREFSKSSKNSYRCKLKFFFQFIQKSPLEVNKNDTKRYLRYLVSKKYSENTIHTRITAIKSFFRYLENEEIISFNPTKAISTSISKNSYLKREILTEEEIARLLEATKHPREKAIFSLMLGAGLRVGDDLRGVCGLNLNSLNLKENYIIAYSKYNKFTKVPLKNWVKRNLEKWLLVRPEVKNNAVFVNNKGKRLTAPYINQKLKEKLREVGITKKITAHNLRHTFGTLCAKHGIPLLEIAELMGHETIETTKIYIKLAQINKTFTEKFPSF